ncbi:hypothetical protein GCM10023074_63070 [Microbispora amethystogenes]|uniref:Uncharacterized protein n=1 Tax=Microbispora amethystogenes TaxID=1427754 RepID=A0ABQ4FND1_9ACTN|nr:hypothetical protein Mam01_64920 [Microbispora amethystogenes]
MAGVEGAEAGYCRVGASLTDLIRETGAATPPLWGGSWWRDETKHGAVSGRAGVERLPSALGSPVLMTEFLIWDCLEVRCHDWARGKGSGENLLVSAATKLH